MRKQDNVAVIINVESFRKKNGEISEFNDREGSGKDAKKLKQLWEDLGFAVEFDKDLESENIVKFLEKVRAKIEKKNNSSCFVCCIMTHGRMGKLYGSDVAPVDINAIVDLFKESNCPALAGKPKMFFIQACREHPDLKEMVPLQQANPHEIDFFIGYSTLPGTHRWTPHIFRFSLIHWSSDQQFVVFPIQRVLITTRVETAEDSG